MRGRERRREEERGRKREGKGEREGGGEIWKKIVCVRVRVCVVHPNAKNQQFKSYRT